MTMGAMRIVTVAVLAAGLGVLGAASAFAGEAAGTSQPRKAKDDTSRRVCRTIVPSGSRLTTRICKTQEQWDAAQEKTQDGVLQHQMTKQTLLEQASGPH
jgi:hypothetical protein